MNAPWLSEVAWQRTIAHEDKTFRWGRIGLDYVGEWLGLLLLRLDANGEMKTVMGAPDASQATFEKITHGEGAAFARFIRGKVSLHASAVEIDGAAMVLVGESGAGKSTVAFWLCASHGAALLADDIAGLDLAGDRVFVDPLERALWLDDGDGAKRPRAMRVAERSVGIGGLVHMGFNDRLSEPELRVLRGASSVKRVLDAALRFDVGSTTWTSEFEVSTALAASAPVWDLERPTSATPGQIAELVASLAQSAPLRESDSRTIGKSFG